MIEKKSNKEVKLHVVSGKIPKTWKTAEYKEEKVSNFNIDKQKDW